MNVCRFVGSVSLLAVATLWGCAATTDHLGSADEELNTWDIPDVAAIEVADVRGGAVTATTTLGSPKKVKGLLDGIQRRSTNTPRPICAAQETVRLTFLGADGAPVASFRSECEGYGVVKRASGATFAVRISGEALATAKAAPFALGDAIWGISKIEVSRPGDAAPIVLTGAQAKPVLDGFDLESVPDANAANPRCMPTHTIKFFRGQDSVARSSFICASTDADPAAKTIAAQFAALNPAAPDADPTVSGGVMVDPSAVLALYRPANP